ncbi:MAG: hypothetical protein EP321_03240 [Sphingomonadales bacterium]|nr:MAG: hypothetical protein EP345_09140 [Sphingomonadales bacterium]TNF05514.1 MAG: hypothetical protein EP321_03240 [Sphingomonadales bacterium]
MEKIETAAPTEANKRKPFILYRILHWIGFAVALLIAVGAFAALKHLDVPGVTYGPIVGSIGVSIVAALLLLPPLFWTMPKILRSIAYVLLLVSLVYATDTSSYVQAWYERTPQGAREATDRAQRKAEEARERADSERLRAEEDRQAEAQERLEALSTSCDDTGDIERAIKERLKDPASAVFNDIIYSKARDRACVAYNAKNSFGGYGEPARAELKCGRDGWTVVNMESPCDDANSLELSAAWDIEKEKIVTARRREWDELFRIARKAPNDFNIRSCRKTRETFGRLVEEVVDLERKAESEGVTDDEKRLIADDRRTIASIKAGAAKGICAAENPE